ILEPEVLDYVENEKWDFAKDLFPYLMRLGKHLFGYTSDSFWVDVGELKGYLKGVNWVLRNFAADPPKDARLIGNPSEPVFARGDVKIGRGTQMLGPSWIDNETSLGENVQIRPGTVLKEISRLMHGSKRETRSTGSLQSLGTNHSTLTQDSDNTREYLQHLSKNSLTLSR